MGSDHLWDALGAIGQIVGAVAVVITLGYLTLQVRHARAEAQRALSQGRGEALQRIIEQHLDPRISRVLQQANESMGGQSNAFVRALREQTGLSEEDASIAMWNQVSWWNYFLQIIPRLDDLSPIERAQFEVPIRNLYGPPGVPRLFFETYIRRVGHPDAVAYMERLIAPPG